MAEHRFNLMSLFSVEGLVAVITGGGSGLGSAMARGLAANGATVYILGRRLAKLQEVAQTPIPHPAGRIIAIECDVSHKESLQAAAAEIDKRSGFVNLVVANAGILGPLNTDLDRSANGGAAGGEDQQEKPAEPAKLTLEEAYTRLSSTSADDFTNTFRVNVTGVHFTAVAFLELLDKGNKRGNVSQASQVVIVSSIGGFHRSWTVAGLSYTTSKAAVTHLVKSLASFLIQFKIRVNGIAPGIFVSEMMGSVFGDRDPSAEGSLPKSIQPLGRTGTEEEMVGTILYLASKAGGYCAGSIQLIDGGRLGVLPGATY